MNALMHSKISCQRLKGCIDDYYPIHDFMDSTKELCSDARHRILHTHWGIKQIVLPIFGHTIVNSDGKEVNVKDMCERDHILVDYAYRFIPTLNDFVCAIQEVDLPGFEQAVEEFHRVHAVDKEMSTLMLSPLAHTGQLKALLITHNSWFINTIIPKIFDRPPRIETFTLSPATFFQAMKFEPWMNNGLGYPPSAHHLKQVKIKGD